MNTQKFKNNGRNKFPLSTETLDFIQEQIKLVYGLTCLAGTNIILKDSSSTVPGLVIVNGELMPLTGTPAAKINVVTTSESVTFLGETIENARISKVAVYSDYTGTNTSSFSMIMDMRESQQHHTPKGTVIDWFGDATCENIPYGWVPCGGFFKTAGGQYQGNGSIPVAITTEKNKWLARYPGATITVDFHYGPNYSYVRIINIPGFGEIPNLSGRFTVGAGYNAGISTSYDFKGTGGDNYVRLTAAQSGLPAHNHIASGSAVAAKQNTMNGYWVGPSASNSQIVGDTSIGVDVTVNSTTAQNASTSHENRPPYFALYKLIKVI